MKLEVEMPPVCECCERYVIATSSNMWLNGHGLCSDCKFEWYEGAGYEDGKQNPTLIKAAVLEKHGQFGGAANLTEALLEMLKEAA